MKNTKCLDTFQLNGGINWFVLSTKAFLNNIGELRYKQNGMGRRILKIKIWNNLVSLSIYKSIITFSTKKMRGC